MWELPPTVQHKRLVFVAKMAAFVLFIEVENLSVQACSSKRSQCPVVQLQPAAPAELEDMHRVYVVWTQRHYYPHRTSTTTTTPLPPPSPPPTLKTTPRRPSSRLPETTSTRGPSSAKACGRLPGNETNASLASTLRAGALVSGYDVRPYQWPWLAHLVIERRFQCGAVLLSERWVLTAAHCIQPWESAVVTLAEHDVTRFEGPEKQRHVKQQFRHEGFIEQQDRGHNDLTLLQLDQPVPLSAKVTPICLPEQGQMMGKGVRCTVAGWGDQSELGNPSAFPRQLVFEIVPIEACREIVGQAIDLQQGHLCARSLTWRSGACQGDSGGPLMCQLDGIYYVLGIVSFNTGACNSFMPPAIFTRVANYVDWIHNKMTKH